jgi:hypothetical protein
MRWPYDGVYPVSSPYGWRSSGFHAGVDFALPMNTPLLACDNGMVVYANYEYPGFGNTVTIRMDGSCKVGYGHMASYIVGVGQRVSAGQTIGLSDNTGSSTGPHLHLWMGEGPNPPLSVDPMIYLQSASTLPPGTPEPEPSPFSDHDLGEPMSERTVLVNGGIDSFTIDDKGQLWWHHVDTAGNSHPANMISVNAKPDSGIDLSWTPYGPFITCQASTAEGAPPEFLKIVIEGFGYVAKPL